MATRKVSRTLTTYLQRVPRSIALIKTRWYGITDEDLAAEVGALLDVYGLLTGDAGRSALDDRVMRKAGARLRFLRHDPEWAAVPINPMLQRTTE